ncbi:hypothetical protein ACYO9G_00165 [Staphylococcus aureus]
MNNANEWNKNIGQEFLEDNEEKVDETIVEPPKRKQKKAKKPAQIFEEDWYALKLESAKTGQKVIDLHHEAIQFYLEYKNKR